MSYMPGIPFQYGSFSYVKVAAFFAPDTIRLFMIYGTTPAMTMRMSPQTIEQIEQHLNFFICFLTLEFIYLPKS